MEEISRCLGNWRTRTEIPDKLCGYTLATTLSFDFVDVYVSGKVEGKGIIAEVHPRGASAVVLPAEKCRKGKNSL